LENLIPVKLNESCMTGRSGPGQINSRPWEIGQACLFWRARGAGKTRVGAEWVRAVALKHRQGRIALIGKTLSDVRSVMVEGVSGLMGVHANHELPKFDSSKKQITPFSEQKFQNYRIKIGTFSFRPRTS
jgi:phage terminase large subunit-like protein